MQLADTETKKVRFFMIEPGEVGNTNLLDIIRAYMVLRPTHINHNRFFINYIHEKCTVQPVGVHKIGRVPQVVAKYLDLENPQSFTGHCFRRTSASILSNAGVSMGDIRRHSEWQSSTAAIGYVDESENSILGEGTSTAELGVFDEIEKDSQSFFDNIKINEQKLSEFDTGM